MKVFISWSGDLSRSLAVELRDWLPMIVQQVDAWISSRDIDPGKRWALVLGRELEQSDFAVICLTRENRNSSWILFEAGAVARSLEARVVPLLFGIEASELDGPLAQFQSLEADEAGIRRLTSSLYDASSSRLDERKRDVVFSKLWPILGDRLASLMEQQRRETYVQSPQDLVEDVAERVNVVPSADVLERLGEERERLARELDYLNAQEEELTRQDAHFSLLQRAIEPTEHRLGRVDATLKKVLDRTVAQLKPSQISMLRSLVTPTQVGVVRPLDQAIVGQQREDLEALKRLGVVAVRDDGRHVVHDMIAAYVSTM
jgi:hypothetical protein